jgi:pyrroloquinoline quinone biosynthesis protein B
MRVRLLGTAAGGGFPQWNCRCPNCVAARENRLPPLAQCSLAFSPSGRSWHLVNATPDVTQQLARWSELHPPTAIRSSPVEGVILTDGELDHVLGLLHLREASRWTLYAAPPVAAMLEEDLRLMPALRRYADVRVQPLVPETPLYVADGSSRVEVRLVPTGTHLPRYLKRAGAGRAAAVGALLLTDTASGARIAYAPCVGELSEALRQNLSGADVILFDGTFWSDDELRRLGAGTQTATAMGHVPVGGPGGSAAWLSNLSARTKLYVHINNTNPLLDGGSPERASIRAMGLEVAADGWTVTV